MLFIGIYVIHRHICNAKKKHATPLVYRLPIVKVLTELVYTPSCVTLRINMEEPFCKLTFSATK